MGSFVFEWHHPAEEVYVTGTFDNWAKSAQLKKENGHFAKQVDLPTTDKKVFYKFVVDGRWVTDHTAPLESDEAGNENNVLLPENMSKIPSGGRSASGSHPSSNPVSSVISGIAPGASTAALAGQQPLEKDLDKNDDKMPGAFPDPTPMEEAQDPSEQSFGVAPIPASSGFGNPVKSTPGDGLPETSNSVSNTVQSNVTTDRESYEKGAPVPEEAAFGVAPLPATSGYGNPIKLAPGEPIPEPSKFTTNDVQSNVTLDKESYEKGGSGLLGPTSVMTGGALGTGAGAGGAAAAFAVPPTSASTIPESSLPMGDEARELETDQGPFISSSAGPGTSTSALAGRVPLETRGVPQVVSESQQEAKVEPEASASETAVEEKSQVEQELKSKVPEEEPTSENKGWLAGGIAAGAAALGGAAAYASRQAGVPQSVQNKLADLSGETSRTADDVPEPVSSSLSKAHESPEAAANPEAVSEKTAMESELLKEVPRSDEVGEPAPGGSSSTEPVAGLSPSDVGGGVLADSTPAETTSTVPDSVIESQQKAHEAPEASANPEAVTEKSAVESELLKEVPRSEDTGESAPGPNGSSSAAPVAGLGAATLGGGVLASSFSDGSTTGVPETVTESQTKAHESPEASANPEAVTEKSAVESELLREVPRTEEAGEPAPTVSAAHTLTAPDTTVPDTGARITDPTDIPSADPNVILADAETMPAIAVANGQIAPPGIDYPTVHDAPYSADNGASTIPPKTATEESHYGRDAALGGVGAGAGALGGAAAYKVYASRQDPIANTTASQPVTASPPSGQSSTTRSVIDRVFGSPTVNDTPISTQSTTTGTTSTSAVGATTPSYPPVNNKPFAAESVAAAGVDAPATTSSASQPEPRTTPSALTSAPVSTYSEPPASSATTSVPAKSTSGLNASATDPAQSGATEIGQLAKENEAPPVSATGKTLGSTTTTTTTTPPTTSVGNTGATTSATGKTTAAIPSTVTSATGNNTTATSATDKITSTNPSTATSATGKTVPANPSAMAAAVAASSKSRAADSRDVSPFSGGPAVTAGVGESRTAATSQGPSTPSKKTTTTSAAQGTPTSATGSVATGESSKSSRRRSKMGSWFSEHFGSERKSKK